METTTENQNQSNVELQSLFTTLLHPRLREYYGKENRDDCKNLRTMEFVVRLCLLVMSKDNHKVSPRWLAKHELNKDDITRHAKVDKENSWGLNPAHRTTDNSGMLRAGEMVFPGKSTQMLSQYQIVLIQSSTIIPSQRVRARNIYLYTYMNNN